MGVGDGEVADLVLLTVKGAGEGVSLGVADGVEVHAGQVEVGRESDKLVLVVDSVALQTVDFELE